MQKVIYLVFSLLMCFTLAHAQVPTTIPSAAQASAELKKRNIDENELRRRLQLRGIDIDRVRPEQLPQLQAQIEEVIAEMEGEQGGRQVREREVDIQVPEVDTGVVDTLGEDSAEKLLEGATEEEAVAEAINESIQEDLPPSSIYGHDIFQNKSLKLFRSVDDVKPPDTYELGVGDEVAISIFGASQADLKFTIDQEGFIKPSRIPRIYLKGVELGQARELIESRMRSYYLFQPGQISINISAARTIGVNIFGETQRNGTFTISAINTALNALVAAGGPTEKGSVRNIKLIRAREERIVDVYDFINNPSVQYDFFLENNDIIFVPLAEKLVAIRGGIRRPFRYELQEDEGLADLIELAGGFSSRAYRGLIQVTRYVSNQEVVIDVDLEALARTGDQFELQDGDEVFIREVDATERKSVEIEGEVLLPGLYAFREGMQLKELIELGQPLPTARLDVAFLLRERIDGTTQIQQLDLGDIIDGTSAITLLSRDRLLIYPQSTYIDEATFTIVGAVRRPLDEFPFPADQELRLSDALQLAGGLRINAAAEGFLVRTNFVNREEREYLRVDVKAALENPGSAADVLLQPFDQLRVYGVERYTDSYSVAISGAVREPGEFNYDPDLTIADLVLLSGGLLENTDPAAFVISTDQENPGRLSYRRFNIITAISDPASEQNVVLQPGDRVSVYSRDRYTDLTQVQIRGAVREPGEFQFDSTLLITDLIQLAGGFELGAATNRIDVFRVTISGNNPTQSEMLRLEMDRNYRLVNGPANFKLQPYDIVVVRRTPDFELQETVEVLGEVYFPGVYSLQQDNERLSDLVQRAGGITPEGFPAGAMLQRAVDNVGFVVIELDKVLNNPGQNSNIILRSGDIITIPKSQELVTIQTRATEIEENYTGEGIADGTVVVAYQGAKSGRWYVNQYAAGFDEKARRRSLTVEYPNGEIKQVRQFLFFKSYPKVRPGSTVAVELKPEKEKREEEENPTKWRDVLAESIAIATTVLTLILLVDRL